MLNLDKALTKEIGRDVATPQEAQDILGIPCKYTEIDKSEKANLGFAEKILFTLKRLFTK